MDSPASSEPDSDDSGLAVSAVLAEVTCTWGRDSAKPAGKTRAAVLHRGGGMLVLEASDPRPALPPLGTTVFISSHTEQLTARLAERGRGGRFLLALGDRPVRGSLRLKVSLPGTVRSSSLVNALPVEIVDLTTGGARVRGVELPVGSQVTLDFTPPGREDQVSVKALVAHGTHRATQPWIGVRFRLVAMRGGR